MWLECLERQLLRFLFLILLRLFCLTYPLDDVAPPSTSPSKARSPSKRKARKKKRTAQAPEWKVETIEEDFQYLLDGYSALCENDTSSPSEVDFEGGWAATFCQQILAPL